ncbi:MAG TPA: ABC transporter permease, partial [Polyangiaceae bacterium]|nr:ABC transporter permease [Polyangiaceae bacterium]
LAVLIGGVGALGLGSALGVSLSERTRELGVLRALGATGRDVRNSVIVEGVLIGGLSIGLAVLAGFGLALLVGDVVGRMSFRVPLPPTLSLRAVAAWTLGALALGAVGGLLPALRAQKLSVRAALAWFLALATVGTVWLLPTTAAASATHGPLALGLPVPQRNVTVFQQIKRQTRDGRRR